MLLEEAGVVSSSAKRDLLFSLRLIARIWRLIDRSTVVKSMSASLFFRMLLGTLLINSVTFLAALLKIFWGTRKSLFSLYFYCRLSWSFLRTSKAKARRALFLWRPVSRCEWSLVLICSSDSAYSPKKLSRDVLRHLLFSYYFCKMIYSFCWRFSSRFLASLAFSFSCWSEALALRDFAKFW